MFNIAIFGRPNVGKSTLFNALVRGKKAIVSNVSGVTVDRNYGIVKLNDISFNLIDTAGILDKALHKNEFTVLLKALQNIIEEDGSKILFIKLNKEISPYIASKGSITIEGISLTVNDVKNDYFNVNIIPFTWDNTNLRNIKVNDFVNVEIDLLSRYLVNYQKRKDN